uniref:Uncharacterized protein n=1 Tax=Anguilla anguilla TaxID=7936 RepID=A0A0E9V0B0_ANGAN
MKRPGEGYAVGMQFPFFAREVILYPLSGADKRAKCSLEDTRSNGTRCAPL